MAGSWTLVAEDLKTPHGLAFDDEDTLFVAEIEGGRIVRIVDDRVQVFAETGGKPRGIAFDDSGDLFVAESARHHLLLISLDEAVEVYANQCRGQRVAAPQELCFSPEGDVLFTDWGREGADGSVYRADLDGEVNHIANGLESPTGMVWSQDASTLFVSETGQNRIVSLDLDDAGENLENQQTLANFENGTPGALMFDSQGSLYVAVQGVGIVILDDAGDVVETLEIGSGRLAGMAFGGLEYDDLYVADTEEGKVYCCHREVSGQRPFAGPRSV